MDDSQPLSMHTRRKTHRVRGPRPCSWISSSSDSSSNEPRDIWPWPGWPVPRSILSRGSTLRSTTSSASLDSCLSSSSSSPLQTPNILVECSEEPYSRHAHRRKPAGPRAPRNSSGFDVRPRLLINTSLPAIPQLEREISPTTPVQSAAVMPHSPHIPPRTINSPTNFPLDWDAIFEILGCSEALPDGMGTYFLNGL